MHLCSTQFPILQARVELDYEGGPLSGGLTNRGKCMAGNPNQPRISFAFLLSVVIRTNKQCSPSAVKEA